MHTNHTPSISSIPNFSPDSRVWVYTCDRALTPSELQIVQSKLNDFCSQWTAHNQALQAVAEVFENQFVILMVDETMAGASGCSIDKSVHFLEQLGDAIQVDFFERMRFAWIGSGGAVQFANPAELSAALSRGEIQDNTLMANTLVQTKRDLAEKWWTPFSKSWHRRLAMPRS